MMSKFIDHFVPDDLDDESGIETRRARMGVSTAFTIVFWAVLAASISAFGGSYFSALGLILCGTVVATAPWVLLKTRRMDIAGHLIVTPIYILLMWLVHENEGLDAPAIVWLTMIPLLASLFLGKRIAKIWLRVIVLSWLVVTVAMLMGYDFPTHLPPKVADRSEERRVGKGRRGRGAPV